MQGLSLVDQRVSKTTSEVGGNNGRAKEQEVLEAAGRRELEAGEKILLSEVKVRKPSRLSNGILSSCLGSGG